jgi:organic hydroperoxide reductase OsmC/OhrA
LSGYDREVIVSEHRVNLHWQRTSEDFHYDRYNREHRVEFGGGLAITGSAAQEYRGKPEHPNPEEALVYAAASCHMLSFLAIAAKRKLVVDGYEDRASGVLAKNAEGRLAITRITLRPVITWAGEAPSHETLTRMHEASHRECFIANSLKSEVVVEGL